MDNFGATTAGQLALELEIMSKEGNVSTDLVITPLEAELEHVKLAVAGLIRKQPATVFSPE